MPDPIIMNFPVRIVLKSFIPKRMQARSLYAGEAGKKQEARSKQKHPKIKLTTHQQKVIKQITEKSNLKFYLHTSTSSEKTEVYISAILKLKKQKANSQFLILLPELILVPLLRSM